MIHLEPEGSNTPSISRYGQVAASLLDVAALLLRVVVRCRAGAAQALGNRSCGCPDVVWGLRGLPGRRERRGDPQYGATRRLSTAWAAFGARMKRLLITPRQNHRERWDATKPWPNLMGGSVSVSVLPGNPLPLLSVACVPVKMMSLPGAWSTLCHVADHHHDPSAGD